MPARMPPKIEQDGRFPGRSKTDFDAIFTEFVIAAAGSKNQTTEPVCRRSRQPRLSPVDFAQSLGRFLELNAG